MWVKTYAPQSFDSMVGNPDLVKRFAMMCKTQYLQHMILCGPSGVGKSLVIKILIDNLLGEVQQEAVLQFNSADERSNQVIREKIHQFVPKKISASSPKMIIFRQAEQLGEGAQQIMRRLMECHYHHAVFIFVCSHLNGILETLQSRCHIFRFTPISIEHQLPYLRNIVIKEGINADDDALRLIANLSNGDMRSSLNYLQAVCCTLEDKHKRLQIDSVRLICLFPHYKHVDNFFNLMLDAAGEGNSSLTELTREGFHSSLMLIRELHSQGYCGRDIIMFLLSYLKTSSERIPKQLHLGFVKDVSIGQQRLTAGIDSYTQLAGVVAALYRRAMGYRVRNDKT